MNKCRVACVNLLQLSDAMCRHRSGATLAQVLAWCLTRACSIHPRALSCHEKIWRYQSLNNLTCLSYTKSLVDTLLVDTHVTNFYSIIWCLQINASVTYNACIAFLTISFLISTCIQYKEHKIIVRTFLEFEKGIWYFTSDNTMAADGSSQYEEAFM